MPWMSSCDSRCHHAACEDNDYANEAMERPCHRSDGPTADKGEPSRNSRLLQQMDRGGFVKNTASSVIIRCLENHFTHHGIPETLRMDNGSNLVSCEMEEFLDELGVKHKKTIPLWPRANGQVERQNKSLPKAMRAAQAEGKPWQ